MAMVSVDDSNLQAHTQPQAVGLVIRVGNCMVLFCILSVWKIRDQNFFVITSIKLGIF